MVSPATIRTATDAWVTSKRPKMNHSSEGRLRVSAGGDGNIQQAFIFFALPFPRGATVLSAKLRIRNAKDTGEATTVTVSRIIEAWKAGKLNWDNKPAVTGTDAASVTKAGNTPADSVWELDVTSMMGTVSNLGGWWGFRIFVDTQTAKVFYSANSPSIYRPELEVAWSDAPEAPETLSPSGGRSAPTPKPLLTFDFTDNAGNEELNACQVQFSSSSAFTAVTWDSGTVNVSEPQLDLTTTTAPALTSTLTWWRVRVQDASGLWSEWSDPESMNYIAKSVVTINSPGASPNNFVNDATPPILWSFGGIQTAYKVVLRDASEPDTVIWNSGKITSTETSVTIPKGKITSKTKTYQIDVLVWDNADRQMNNGEPIYSIATQVFTFKTDATVAKVSSVIATQQTPWPWVNISWTQATAADEYNILRDGEIIDANVPAADLVTGTGTYKYQDRLASPRASHTWGVQAVVNSKASDEVSSNSLTTRLLTTMMMELDGTDPIFFMNPAVDPQSMTTQTIHQPLNAPPVLITQYQGGYEGHLEGLLVDGILPGLSAKAMRNKFKKWQKNQGDSYYLYLIDEVLIITPYNMTYKPEAKSGSVVRYRVAFDFFEGD